MRSIRLALGLGALLAAAGAGQAAPPPPAKPVPTVDNLYTLVDCLVAAKDRDLEKVLSIGSPPDNPKSSKVNPDA